MVDIVIPEGEFVRADNSKGNEQPAQEPKPKTIVRKPEKAPIAPPEPNEEKDEAEESQEEEAPKAMTEKEKKIWKLKAGDEEFDFDASDEEAVKREIQKARGSQKRFEEAAKMRKEADAEKQGTRALFQAMKDPAKLEKLLEDPRLGVNLEQFAKDYLWKKMQYEEMSPEEREQAQVNAEKEQRLKKLEDYERREKEYLAKQEEDKKAKVKQDRAAKYEIQYSQKIMEALQDNSLPKTQEIVDSMAYHIEAAIEQGYDISPKEIAAIIKAEKAKEYQDYLSALSDEEYAAFVGENAEKQRRIDAKRFRTPTGNPFESSPSRNQDKVSAPARRRPADEGRANMIKDYLARK